MEESDQVDVPLLKDCLMAPLLHHELSHGTSSKIQMLTKVPISASCETLWERSGRFCRPRPVLLCAFSLRIEMYSSVNSSGLIILDPSTNYI